MNGDKFKYTTGSGPMTMDDDQWADDDAQEAIRICHLSLLHVKGKSSCLYFGNKLVSDNVMLSDKILNILGSTRRTTMWRLHSSYY